MQKKLLKLFAAHIKYGDEHVKFSFDFFILSLVENGALVPVSEGL